MYVCVCIYLMWRLGLQNLNRGSSASYSSFRIHALTFTALYDYRRVTAHSKSRGEDRHSFLVKQKEYQRTCSHSCKAATSAMREAANTA